jgi:hypothetical protein
MESSSIVDNRSIRILLSFFIISFSYGLCQASIIVIEQGESIQAAIDKAHFGDTIGVHP